MSGFFAVSWPQGWAPQAILGELSLALRARGWREAGRGPRVALWAAPDLAVEVLPGEAGWILGEAFAHPGAAASGPPRGAVGWARHLVCARWGGYVALLCDPDGAAAALVDPSAAGQALHWRRDGLSVLASDFAAAPPRWGPPQLAIDWSVLGEQLAAPTSCPLASPLSGVAVLAPGSLLRLAPDEAETAVWSPARIARTGGDIDPGDDHGRLQAGLVERVDGCVAALAGPAGPLICEVSGGLDSAIVAASLARAGLADRVAQWLNHVGDRPEGDERAYAAAVTERLGRELVAAPVALRPLTEADYADTARGLRPAFNALDVALDRAVAERLTAAGAGAGMAAGAGTGVGAAVGAGAALVSGQGGDAVFFQMPTPLIAWEHLRAGEGLGATAVALSQMARRNRCSIYELLFQAMRGARRGAALPSLASPLLSRDLAEATRGLKHRWEAEAEGLSPAKRLHIRAIANAQLDRGADRRSAAGRVILPLLAQPVVEFCLALPARLLAGGDRDRAFARAAFADRLPAVVAARRAKGDVTSYYARLTAMSLPFLRPHLLDGTLASAGLLDRSALEQALDPDRLLWAAGSGPILAAAAVESWVRHWQGLLPDRAPRGASPPLRDLEP